MKLELKNGTVTVTSGSMLDIADFLSKCKLCSYQHLKLEYAVENNDIAVLQDIAIQLGFDIVSE